MLRRVLVASAFFITSAAFGKSPVPFKVVTGLDQIKAGKVMYQQNQVSLVMQSDAKRSDFKDLYVANMEGARTFVDMAKYGEVLHHEPGMFAVLRMVDEAPIAQLSGTLHQIGQGCGSLIHMTGRPIVDRHKIVDPTPIFPVSTKREDVTGMITRISSERIRASVQEISAVHTRFHSSTTGKGMAEMLATMYRSQVQGRDDVEIGSFSHGDTTPQDSLVVRIRGTQKPDEIVILGSHLDSITGWFGNETDRSPGADDNASGTATNLEIFRVLMENGFRPSRTIEIHAYAAEEMGLLGSQDMAEKYSSANKKVVAMLQHDMTIYNSNGQSKIYFVSNKTNAALNTALTKLMDNYVSIPYELKVLRDGSSDHESWTNEGFAAAFPFEDPNDYNESIHTEDDTIENSGKFSQAAAFAQLGLAYVAHFAGN